MRRMSEKSSQLVMAKLVLLPLLVSTCLLASGATAEGISLAFVFDTTSSMSGELSQVIAGAQSILQAAINSTIDWRDFILVPFNDPDVGPVTTTTDPDEFERSLASISVTGGGDCPEMSIGGVKQALEVARPQSYLYVFTDASAKDYELTDQVINIIQEKQSKVYFVTTGDCGSVTAEDFSVYEEIAGVSSGQVFNVERGDVSDILDAIITISIKGVSAPSVNGSQVTEANLLSLDKPTPTSSDGDIASISIDSASSGFTVSLSGGDPNILVFDSTGLLLQESNVEVVLQLSTLEMLKVDDLSPGGYTLNYTSTTSHSLRVKGSSTISFDQRFETSINAVNFDLASPRPYEGIPVYTLIRGIGLKEGDVLIRLQFIRLNGTVLNTLPLYSTDYNPGVYFTNATVVPSGSFLVQMFGVDSGGFEINRISQSAISAVVVPDDEECLLGTHSCDPNARCNDTIESYECSCNPGYTGDGKLCTNVDECSLEAHSCDTNANCTDTAGSYECTCNPGYEGDGKNCTNVNECTQETHSCDSNAFCADTIGSYECACISGYEGDGKSCTAKPSTAKSESSSLRSSLMYVFFCGLCLTQFP